MMVQVMEEIGKFVALVQPERKWMEKKNKRTVGLWQWIKNTETDLDVEHDVHATGPAPLNSDGLEDAGRPYWKYESTMAKVDELRKALPRGEDGSKIILEEAGENGWLCRIARTMMEAIASLERLMGLMVEASELINAASSKLLKTDHTMALKDLSIVAKFPADGISITVDQVHRRTPLHGH